MRSVKPADAEELERRCGLPRDPKFPEAIRAEERNRFANIIPASEALSRQASMEACGDLPKALDRHAQYRDALLEIGFDHVPESYRQTAQRATLDCVPGRDLSVAHDHIAQMRTALYAIVHSRAPTAVRTKALAALKRSPREAQRAQEVLSMEAAAAAVILFQLRIATKACGGLAWERSMITTAALSWRVSKSSCWRDARCQSQPQIMGGRDRLYRCGSP